MVQAIYWPEVIVLLLLLLQCRYAVLLQQLHLHENFVLLAALLKVNQLLAGVRLCGWVDKSYYLPHL